MISQGRFRQYVASTGARPEVALQEVVLTYALAALYAHLVAKRLVFEGGTALRKLVVGPSGRFSVDLDFLGAGLDDDDLLGAVGVLEVADFHGVEMRPEDVRFSEGGVDEFGAPAPDGCSATVAFRSPLGEGTFGRDISRRRHALAPLRTAALVAEPYHRHVEFALPSPLTLALEEAIAEKVSALLRRMGHGNAKDVYDLWLYLQRPHERVSLARLTALTLWFDRRDAGDPARMLSGLTPDAFDWEELAGLLPRRQLDPDAVCSGARGGLLRMFDSMEPDCRRLLEDATHHANVGLWEKVNELVRRAGAGEGPHSVWR